MGVDVCVRVGLCCCSSGPSRTRAETAKNAVAAELRADQRIRDRGLAFGAQHALLIAEHKADLTPDGQADAGRLFATCDEAQLAVTLCVNLALGIGRSQRQPVLPFSKLGGDVECSVEENQVQRTGAQRKRTFVLVGLPADSQTHDSIGRREKGPTDAY